MLEIREYFISDIFQCGCRYFLCCWTSSYRKRERLASKRKLDKNKLSDTNITSVEGEFGIRHNAYVTDEDGIVWNTYHARQGVDGARSSGIRRVHFDIDGVPMLDLTEDRDLVEKYKKIETVLVVDKNG